MNKNEIYSSSYLAAAYLKSKNFKKKAYLLGESALMEEMKEAGIDFLIHQNPNESDKITSIDQDIGG